MAQVELNEHELYIIINALNYAKGEWEIINDEELTKLAEDADKLEKKIWGKLNN